MIGGEGAHPRRRLCLHRTCIHIQGGDCALRLILVALLLMLSSPGFAATKYFAERKPVCLQCHGEKGVSQTPEVPSLGGIPEYYALLQLVAFRERNRKNEIMIGMVKDMTDDDLRAAAALVASFPPPPAPAEAGDPARMKRGRKLAAKNRCGACHGPKFSGGHQMPPLAHQREDYLLKALRDFKSEKRLGDRAAMVEIVAPLKDADLADLAHYLAHIRLTER
jgi:cytochrome c553